MIEYYPDVLWKADPHEPDFLGGPTVEHAASRIEIGGEVVEIAQGKRATRWKPKPRSREMTNHLVGSEGAPQ